ncbi:MAG: trypsin-like peptidase domain-containing protein [Verrucomicrobiae bacterium]|nr:trypsin-like peptidase domain-containing protein [Verrucomicrobiae bacterium]
MITVRHGLWVACMSAVAFTVGAADTVRLKDDAAITGRIIAEKRDAVVVDVGYTALVIPRQNIAEIIKDDGADTKPGRASRKRAPDKPVAASETPSPPSPVSSAPVASAPANGFYRVATRSAPTRDVRELVSELGEAVVQVRTPASLGSGFFINEEGYLITNFHVIEGETQISVEVYWQRGGQLERKTYKQVRIVALNKFADLALLKVEDAGAPRFKSVVFGSADAMAVGERVFAIGSPLGLERTVTEGILSTKTRPMQGVLYLQTTAQINPGNSGGPLFNLHGEVIGVTNMKIAFGEGLGFAIPSESVRYFLDHRDAFAYSNDNPSNPYRYLEPPGRTRQPTPTQ